MTFEPKSEFSKKSRNFVSKKGKDNRQLIGQLGENCIADYLIQRGFQIIERNWRTKDGELDLIAKSPSGKFHFVEVKTRSSHAFGHPLESIDREKAHRLQKLTLAWLATNAEFGSDYQIDVAAVTLTGSLSPIIDYRTGVL